MKNKTLYLMLVSALLLIMACDHLSNGSLNGNKAPANTILIEYHYVNFAWGYIDSRSFLTTDGKLSVFSTRDRDDPRLNQWTVPDDEGWIMEEDLIANYLLADSVRQGVEVQALQDRNVASLARMVEEDLSAPEGRCIDAGTFTLWAYHWNEQEEKYQRKMVEQCGDLAIKNEHNSAQKLIEQLNELTLFARGCCF